MPISKLKHIVVMSIAPVPLSQQINLEDLVSDYKVLFPIRSEAQVNG